MRVYLLLILLLFVRVHLTAQARFSPPEEALRVMKSINSSTLMGHIRFLSDDLLEGRAPGTRGDELARAYIASQMEMLGLEPGGENGTFYQRVPIVSMRTDPSAVLTASNNHKSVALTFGSEFVGFPGVQEQHVSLANAEIVFVGYGIVAPEQNWDDYKDVDVKGKVLLMLNNDPSPEDPQVFGGKARTYYGRWTYKYEIAARKGAAGAIIVHTTESAGYGWNVVESSWSRERFELERRPGAMHTILNAWTTSAATDRILELAGRKFTDLEYSAQSETFKPVPLGITLSSSLTTSIGRVVTSNVIGVLRGSDPDARDEAVILTAHYDHLGIGKTVNGDSICNGALDNASGVSAMLNMARMFATMQEPPRRTTVFAAVGAEESGLLGSQYYAENPTFPPARIAANINIDGINIFGKTSDVVLIGMGKTSIDEIVKQVAEWQGRVVKPDQFPEQGTFYRSDQFNFAKIGVPCLYPRSGLEYVGKPADFGKRMVEEYIREHYHQPSDEIRPDWNLNGAVEDMQLLYLVALTISNAEDMPSWTAGDEFEGIRRMSLKGTNY